MTLRFFVPKSNSDQFELAALINPRSFRINLIDSQLDIMPVANSTAQRERLIITRAGNWCDANPNLVGLSVSSQGCFALPTGDLLGPDFAVVLTARWNTLTVAQQNQTFTPVAPDFVIELRSQTDTRTYCHNKMMRWIIAGVDEGWLIDRYVNPPEVAIYTFDANTSEIVVNVHSNPRLIASQVLNGFIMNMHGLF